MESIVNDLALSVLKQGIQRIKIAVSKSDTRKDLEQMEEILDIFQRVKNVKNVTSLSQEELEQVFKNFEEFVKVGNEFLTSSSWNLPKNLNLTSKLKEIKSKLQLFLQGPLQASIFAEVLNLRDMANDNSRPIFQSYLHFGRQHGFKIGSNKQYLGASGIRILASFDGTVTRPVNFKAGKKEKCAFTFLNVRIPGLTAARRSIELTMFGELAERCIKNLDVNDRVFVSGWLGTYINHSVNNELMYTVKVTKLKKRRSRYLMSQIRNKRQAGEAIRFWFEVGDVTFWLSEQYLGASRMLFFTRFEGSVSFEPQINEKDCLCISISQSNVTPRSIRLKEKGKLGEWCRTNLLQNDHIFVNGWLSIRPDADNDKHGLQYEVDVTLLDILKLSDGQICPMYEELQSGKGLDILKDTNKFIQLISNEQYFESLGMRFFASFEGSVTQPIEVKKQSEEKMVYTFLLVSIPQSKCISRLIKLEMRVELNNQCNGLCKKDRIFVSGWLMPCVEADQNENSEVPFKVTVTNLKILNRGELFNHSNEGSEFEISGDGIKGSSKLYVQDSGIWIFVCFEGTVTERVNVEEQNKETWAYTFLRVGIPNSNGAYWIIKLMMLDKLANSTSFKNLAMDDRVSISGLLSTSRGADEKSNQDQMYQVIVEKLDYVKNNIIPPIRSSL